MNNYPHTPGSMMNGGNNNNNNSSRSSSRHTPYNMYQQPAQRLLVCKLPNSNAISCIVDRDMTVENTIIRIKSQAKTNFNVGLPNEDKISLSTVSRFGYSIPLGSNERIGNYFPNFDGEIFISTTNKKNNNNQIAKSSPKKQKRKADTLNKPTLTPSSSSSSSSSSNDDNQKKKKIRKKKKKKAKNDANDEDNSSNSNNNQDDDGDNSNNSATAQIASIPALPVAAKTKAKKKKKVKDPNAPKRPTNAFISFSNIMRKNWKGSSKIEMADITEAWKSKKQAKLRLSLEKKYTKEFQLWKKKN